MLAIIIWNRNKAKFKRRTFHVPNLMLKEQFHISRIASALKNIQSVRPKLASLQSKMAYSQKGAILPPVVSQVEKAGIIRFSNFTRVNIRNPAL